MIFPITILYFVLPSQSPKKFFQNQKFSLTNKRKYCKMAVWEIWGKLGVIVGNFSCTGSGYES